MEWAKKIEPKLILFFVYVGMLVYLLATVRNLWIVLGYHILFVFIYSIYHFGREFLFIAIAPLMAVYQPVHNWFVARYLKKFKQNTPAEAVIVLAHSDWYKLEAWVKPNYFITELKTIVSYLQKKGQDFSFYTNATFEDVEKIMADKNIKEVYFLGHGTSHVFQLCTDDILYYCDFNDPKYGKEFVHQVHCGTPDGKSLVDYVVSEENKSGCFLIRKSITAIDIEKEFHKRAKTINTH